MLDMGQLGSAEAHVHTTTTFEMHNSAAVDDDAAIVSDTNVSESGDTVPEVQYAHTDATVNETQLEEQRERNVQELSAMFAAAMMERSARHRDSVPSPLTQEMVRSLSEELRQLCVGQDKAATQLVSVLTSSDTSAAEMRNLLVHHPQFLDSFTSIVDRYEAATRPPRRRRQRHSGATPKRPRVRLCTCDRS